MSKWILKTNNTWKERRGYSMAGKKNLNKLNFSNEAISKR
jgi:hypothetical protein